MNWQAWLIIVVVMGVGCLGCEKDGRSTEQRKEGTSRPAGQADTQIGKEPQAVEKVREAAVAGLWYPRDKGELEKAIDGFLAQAETEPIGKIRALICPHAGVRFSGLTAAFGFGQLTGRDIKTVVVLAPSHYATFEGASVPDVDAYRTPLGLVMLSPKAKQLAKRSPFVSNPECRINRPGWWRQASKELPPFGTHTPHTWEHSLEVELPFLQRVLKDFSIIPVVLGDVNVPKATRVLLDYMDEQTLLVASTDLSHHHPYQTARRMDARCVGAICALNAEAVTGELACGWRPVQTLIYIAKVKGWKAKLLDYRNSGDTAGDKKRVVGYAAIAFYEETRGTPASSSSGAVTASQRQFLLKLARSTLVDVIKNRRMPKVSAAGVPAALRAKRGCFVTLTTKEGLLRGCIGHTFPQEALYLAVMHNAMNAALRDKRFPAVQPEDLDGLDIEVSVLTVPRPLQYDSPEDLLKKLRPDIDGVVLRMGRYEATYLPGVWKKIPDKQVFLNELCKKAGLPSWAWKRPEATILVYQAEAFEE